MKILLAEDDVFFQKFYAQKLREQGFDVDTVSNGEEALTKLQSTEYTLMLLDIIMPKKNGFDVLRYLKEHSEFHHPSIIVFSTLGQEQDIKNALQLGAHDYVNKTFFDFDNLLNKINLVIQQSQKPT